MGFHDSCYLGRWNNTYSSPRDILKKAITGKLVEVPQTRDAGFY
jgi:Fe-S oxidoreductase